MKTLSFKDAALCSALLLAIPTVTLAGDKDRKPVEKEKDPEEITCKTTRVVGSRIPERICMKNSEWEARQQGDQDAVQSSRNRASACGSVRC